MKSSAIILAAFDNVFSPGDDGWAQIAPLGDFPGLALVADDHGGFKKVRAIQRIDKEAVANMVNDFQQSTRTGGKYLRSRPIFKGHPDMPGYGNKYPDKTPKGVFGNLTARDDGFFGQAILTPEGEQAITEGHNALSGRWEAEFIGEENGTQVFRPTRFLSAGLTNTPNLPVQLLNEKDDDGDVASDLSTRAHDASAKAYDADEENAAKEHTAAAGAHLSAAQAHDKLGNRGMAKHHRNSAEAHASYGREETAEVANSRDRLRVVLANHGVTISNDADEIQLRDAVISVVGNLKTQFDNERKARIDDELGAAMVDGRMTGAELVVWRPRLEGPSFINELQNLRSLPRKIKTQSIITRGDRRIDMANLANASERRDLIQSLVTEVCTTNKWDRVKDYDRAFQEVQKRHPALFENGN